ncbi:UDP:flavonoid glycosyltransferase YjiC (YdhE family) [Paenibacillus cellulosilyticus]|uniref:UDP:flavonoid glycosyltransferase YjiC (YdhE family) n=1 Tax=Paenibacillus cellulosilyticus TaxID=375489 RepID=A0A2V2YU96_9BACL|nr:glycosyltransferase [Paenibacillus cellulosilyticus]PWW03197.1 UDP:flavonoid glycosyltransferase YjiC (YdhE family) [Paenibacillus cellulosilyticus]QKS43687.1 glycosyltransferase family 1 protein [Paenibacillus cellulosilyticus]
MRILFISSPAYGHIDPILSLGQELNSQGVEVWVATDPAHQSLIESIGLRFLSFPWFTGRLFEFEKELKALYETVQYQRDQLDLLVCEASTGAALVAEASGIPWVSYQTFISSKEPFSNEQMKRGYIQSINKSRKAIGLRSLSEHDSLEVTSPLLHLVMIMPEMIDEDTVFPSKTLIAGPCYLETVDNRQIAFLEDMPPNVPIVLVCTPSLDSLKPDSLRYVEASLQAFAQDECLVIISIDPSMAKSSTVFNNLPPSVLIVTDYPMHHKLMQIADVIITHGGLGTIQRAIAYGVPQLVIPLGFDHFVNAEHSKRTGRASIISLEHVSPNSLKSSVDALMHSIKNKKERIYEFERLKKECVAEIISLVNKKEGQ